jgi:uncharacterized membrane-anchored protein
MIGRAKRKRVEAETTEGLAGTARVDRRTKNLLARLQPGEIAVIDHEDIDRIAAEGLVQRQARAVVNASRSSTGRYPNLGPLLLCSAGIPLIDDCGAGVMKIAEGSRVAIEDGHVSIVNGAGSTEVGRGRRLDIATVEEILDGSKKTIATEIERFAENTIGYIRDERDVFLEAVRLPDVKTSFHGRQVLVVVRGYHYKEDLAALRAYIREVNPLFVGVDGGADGLVEAGLKPDMIVGDMDSVTTEALLSGAEIVVHAYPNGDAPGRERLEALGLEHKVFQSAGTSEDIALLMAFEQGAELIVAVGTHANLVEFLDKGRKGMASTFLVRLRVGPILVDAKGVSRLYRGGVRGRDLTLLFGAALLTMVVVFLLSPPLHLELRFLWIQVKDLWHSIHRALFT